jgi:hypothetical protein
MSALDSPFGLCWIRLQMALAEEIFIRRQGIMHHTPKKKEREKAIRSHFPGQPSCTRLLFQEPHHQLPYSKCLPLDSGGSPSAAQVPRLKQASQNHFKPPCESAGLENLAPGNACQRLTNGGDR